MKKVLIVWGVSEIYSYFHIFIWHIFNSKLKNFMENQQQPVQPVQTMQPQQPKKSKKKMIIIIVVVVLLILAIPVIIMSCLAVAALGGAREKARDAVRISDVKQIVTVVEMYQKQNRAYPDVLDELTSIMPEIPTQPMSGEAYDYQRMPDGSVQVCADMEVVSEEYSDPYCESLEAAEILDQ